MLEIETSLLTGAVSVESDSDGNVRILQNKQEIKLTPSQAKELESYLVALSDTIQFVKSKESADVWISYVWQWVLLWKTLGV